MRFVSGKRLQISDIFQPPSSGCGQLDFLPFLCRGCAKTFCLEHRGSHGCAAPAKQVRRTRYPQISNDVLHTCPVSLIKKTKN